MEYTPPNIGSILFNFRKAGYAPPDYSTALFNFTNVSAISAYESMSSTVTGSPLYLEEAYTYTKQCKKVAIGYENSQLQILSLPCLYGGIRDLSFRLKVYQRDYLNLTSNIVGSYATVEDNIRASVFVYQTSSIDLSALLDVSGFFSEIYGSVGCHSPSDIVSFINTDTPLDLTASIGTHPPVDIYGNIYVEEPSNIQALLSAHLPSNLPVSFHGWDLLNLQSSISYDFPKDLYSRVVVDYPRDIIGYVNVFSRADGNLPSNIGVDFPSNITSKIGTHLPENITALLRVWHTEDFTGAVVTDYPRDLTSNVTLDLPRDIIGYVKPFQHKQTNIITQIHGWQEYELGSVISHEVPSDLYLYLKAFQHTTNEIGFSIRGWQSLDLTANIKHCYDDNMSSILYSHLPDNITANIKSWNSTNLNILLHGWGFLPITASIHPFHKRDLVLSLLPIPPIDLGGQMRVTSHGYKDLYGPIHAFQIRDLGVSAYPLYIFDINSYLFPIVPKDVKATIHGYDERFLTAILLGLEYPYNLTASIASAGELSELSAYIRAYQALGVFLNLPAQLQGFQQSDIQSFIECIGGYDIGAYINSSSYSSNLQAILTPKIVRLSKIVNIHTMEKLDLSAIINVSCFGSNISHIGAYISPIYLRPLSATLNGVVIYNGNYNLTATIGMDNSVIVVDKLPITVNLVDSYRVIDGLSISFRVLPMSADLFSSINGIVASSNIGAYLKAVDAEDYGAIRNVSRAHVYDLKTTYGRAQLEKIVEISFRNYVRDYIYLQKAGYSFARYLGDRWETNISSYLPANVTLGLKRRFHKATTLFKLTSYSNIDEAVRAAIVYVTETPFCNLSAAMNLNFNSMSNNLNAILTPLYTKKTHVNLSSSITGAAPKVIYGKGVDGFVGLI